MKLAIARGFFLVCALGVTSFAAAAWQEPTTQVMVTPPDGAQHLKRSSVDLRPQSTPDQDLLLFIFSLSQSMSAGS